MSALCNASAVRHLSGISARGIECGPRKSKIFNFEMSPSGLRSRGFAQTIDMRVNKKSVAKGFRIFAAQEVRTEQKVKVVLGPYKDGAIKVEAPSPKVSAEDVEKALNEKKNKTSTLERINFTGSGAKIGHTVRISFEGKYAEGPNAGQLVKGTKAKNFELELKERDDEPWKTFVTEITKAGMGQEESKTFILEFPKEYKAPALAGVKARFTVTVHEIGVKKALEEDVRSLEVQKSEIEAELQSIAERKSNEIIDTEIRNQLLASTEADVEKVAASVTWAKFGEKSLSDFKWNVIQEEVARVENIPFDQVPAFLRKNASIKYLD